MSLSEARMTSLKDKIDAQVEEAEKKFEELEKKEQKVELIIKKKSTKENEK